MSTIPPQLLDGSLDNSITVHPGVVDPTIDRLRGGPLAAPTALMWYAATGRLEDFQRGAVLGAQGDALLDAFEGAAVAKGSRGPLGGTETPYRATPPSSGRVGVKSQREWHVRATEVNIYDRSGNPRGNFDVVTVDGTVIEDKSGRGLLLHPEGTAKFAAKTADQARTRLNNLYDSNTMSARHADDRDPTGDPPTLAELRSTVRSVHFRFEADTPLLREEFSRQLDALQEQFPHLTFSAEYGYRSE